MEYQDFLETLSIRELKTLIKKYASHVKILITGKTKAQLIEHLLTHTELKNNKVVTKKIDIGDLPKKEEVKKETKEPKKEKDQYQIMINKYSNKKVWDKLTKQQKEQICRAVKVKVYMHKDKTILAKLPYHIYDYFYKYCSDMTGDIKKDIENIKGYKKEEIKKEDKKEEPIKEVSKKRSIPLLEFLEPYQNYEDTGDKILNDIYLKVGEEIDKYYYDVSILNEKIFQIKDLENTLEKVRNWAEKKTRTGKNEVEYITFVKSIVYNMFFKNELDRLTNNNKFESIAISNIIASDAILQQYYTNRTYKTTVETFFKLKPLIPIKDYPKDIINLYKKLYSEYQKGNLPKEIKK